MLSSVCPRLYLIKANKNFNKDDIMHTAEYIWQYYNQLRETTHAEDLLQLHLLSIHLLKYNLETFLIHCCMQKIQFSVLSVIKQYIVCTCKLLTNELYICSLGTSSSSSSSSWSSGSVSAPSLARHSLRNLSQKHSKNFITYSIIGVPKQGADSMQAQLFMGLHRYKNICYICDINGCVCVCVCGWICMWIWMQWYLMRIYAVFKWRGIKAVPG